MGKLIIPSIKGVLLVMKFTTSQGVIHVNPTKAGVFTSEFLVTVLTQFVGVLVLCGVLTADQASVLDSIWGQLAKFLVDGFTLIYMGKTAWEYIKGRNKLKNTVLQGNQPQPTTAGA